MPALEMNERDHTLFIKLDLPGLKKEEVNVNFTDEGLVIEGERTHETEGKQERVVHDRTDLRPLLPRRAAAGGRELQGGESDIQKWRARGRRFPFPPRRRRRRYKVPVEGEPEAKNVKVAA